MSDEKTTDAPAAVDPLQNFKSEFNRKISAQEDTIKQLVESQKALLSQLSNTNKPSTEPEEDMEALMYSKPAVAAEKIKEKAKAEMRREIAEQNSRTQKQNSVLSSLLQEYPELNNTNNDLTKKAVEIYNSLAEEEKSSPMAYRLAVKEAAAELGVKPASKRESFDDTYSVGGSASTATTGTSTRKRGEELDKATAEFARIMGVDANKVKERAKNRTNWSKYE